MRELDAGTITRIFTPPTDDEVSDASAASRLGWRICDWCDDAHAITMVNWDDGNGADGVCRDCLEEGS